MTFLKEWPKIELANIKINRNNDTELEVAYRVVGMQAIIAVFGAILLFYLMGKEAAESAFFGGTVATANGLVLLRRVKLARKLSMAAPERAIAVLYSSAIIRFVLVLGLFGLGFGVLRLQVLPALIVFALAQLTYGWGLRKSYKELL